MAIPIILLLCAAAADAQADFKFCNRTGEPVKVAIGTTAKLEDFGLSPSGAGVKGWWTVYPDECANLSDVQAGVNWIYYYAYTGLLFKPTRRWGGDWKLCVGAEPNRSFSRAQQFRPAEGCEDDTLLVGFKRIDGIEATKKNYTLNLTE